MDVEVIAVVVVVAAAAAAVAAAVAVVAAAVAAADKVNVRHQCASEDNADTVLGDALMIVIVRP